MFLNKYRLLITILLSIIITPSYSDNFEFKPKVINEKNNVIEYKDIISSGYGMSEKKAIDNAFKSAIQQYVGVIIDSDTQVKNGALIKDEILTASNGYIQRYDILSIINDDGLFEVEIKASVRTQKIFNKVKSLNINTVLFLDGKNKQARVETKLQSKQDISKILFKSLKDFYSTDSLQEMLSIKIEKANVIENKVKDNKVPISITYSLSVNYDAYLNKVNNLENIFKNLGAKKIKRLDLPVIRNFILRSENPKKIINKIKDNEKSFFIVKKYGSGYVLDGWIFPIKIGNDLYKIIKNLEFKKIFDIILEVKSNDVIFAKNITDTIYRDSGDVFTSNISYDTFSNQIVRYSKSNFRGINYLFLSKIRWLENKNSTHNKLMFDYDAYIPIDEVSNIKTISIELEQK